MLRRVTRWSLILLLGVLIGLGARLHRAPIDLNESPFVPEALAQWLDRDDVAYPAHAMLARVLDWTHADPAAVALQWLKAASHARTEAEADRADAGVNAARLKSANSAAFTEKVCRFLKPDESFQRGGLDCLPSMQRGPSS
ncbi:MAG: hypothetical protein IT306_22650 [Chloroflexi bacterium]|nr:hypothetical protein [Chloroflexota bacterium]